MESEKLLPMGDSRPRAAADPHFFLMYPFHFSGIPWTMSWWFTGDGLNSRDRFPAPPRRPPVRNASPRVRVRRPPPPPVVVPPPIGEVRPSATLARPPTPTPVVLAQPPLTLGATEELDDFDLDDPTTAEWFNDDQATQRVHVPAHSPRQPPRRVPMFAMGAGFVLLAGAGGLAGSWVVQTDPPSQTASTQAAAEELPPAPQQRLVSPEEQRVVHDEQPAPPANESEEPVEERAAPVTKRPHRPAPVTTPKADIQAAVVPLRTVPQVRIRKR